MQTRETKVARSEATNSGAILQRACACGQHTTGGGECEECKKSGTLQRHTGGTPAAASGPVHSSVVPILSSAASESGSPIHEPLKSSLGSHLGQDFSQVRVHGGASSAEAAASVGARAYTLGNDIHLGKESQGLSSSAFDRLIAHEAVHTVQQGGRTVAPGAGLTVSDPQDASEQEANRLADEITSASPPSRSLALRDQMRASAFGAGIARSVAPQIQRDLTGKKATADGDFTLNLKTESHPGAKCGMSGTIKFKASDTAPDSDSIRLLQIARDKDLTTGKEYVWTGGEENRNKIMTTATKDVDPGFFVDVLHAGSPPNTKPRTPRTSKNDPEVSPYYIEDYKGSANMQDGSKKGKTITEASLYDYPGSSGKREFSFETAAKATQGANAGYVYATLTWGFTLSDPAKGKVEKEHADAHILQSATFNAAVKSFNEFYKNPGASTAPTK